MGSDINYAISTVCQIFVQRGFHRKFAEMINLWGRDVMGMSHAASGSGIMNIITGGMPRHQQQRQQR